MADVACNVVMAYRTTLSYGQILASEISNERKPFQEEKVDASPVGLGANVHEVRYKGKGFWKRKCPLVAAKSIGSVNLNPGPPAVETIKTY